MADVLQAMTALGGREAVVVTLGPLTVTERFDLALASVAVRRGRDEDLAARATLAGLSLPAPARFAPGTPFAALWVTPGMWMVEAPFETHEAIAAILKDRLGDAASVTEQTDAWGILDLSAPDLAPLLERLCNVDFAGVPDGFATRTVIEHLGCYLVRHDTGTVRLYGPRSSAKGLLHAVEVAAAAAW